MTIAARSMNLTLPETWLDDAPEFDAAKAFDNATGAGQLDPYLTWKQYREQGGVIRHVPVDMAAEAMAIASGEQRMPSDLTVWKKGDPETPASYGLYTYKTVTEALRDPTIFTSTGQEKLIGQIFGHSIIEMDPPEHTQHRALVAQAFRPKVLALWEDGLVKQVIQEQIDSFKADGHANLAKQFTLDFPVKVIAGILGVPLEHSDWFRRRAIEEISIQVDLMRGLEAARVLKEFFKQIIADRRQHPGGTDLISEMVGAELDGHRLSDEEILPFLLLISPAGAETTYRSTGNLLYGLLTNPEQLEAVKADRSLIPQAVEEAIRWETPLTAIARWTTCDTEVEGVRLPAGAEVNIAVGSANRDESIWGPTAHLFDIFRPKHAHVAFSNGHHTCLGIHLARREMAIALNMLLDQCPDVRLDPTFATETHIDGQRFRSPNQLKVLFTPVK